MVSKHLIKSCKDPIKLHSLTMFEYWIIWFAFSVTCKRNSKKVNTEHLAITLLASIVHFNEYWESAEKDLKKFGCLGKKVYVL